MISAKCIRTIFFRSSTRFQMVLNKTDRRDLVPLSLSTVRLTDLSNSLRRRTNLLVVFFFSSLYSRIFVIFTNLFFLQYTYLTILTQ